MGDVLGDCYKVFLKYELNPDYKQGGKYRCLHDFDYEFLRKMSQSLYGFELNLKENWFRCYFCEHDDEELFLYRFAEFVKFFMDKKIKIEYIFLGELMDYLDSQLWEGGAEELEFSKKYLLSQKIVGAHP